MKIDYLLQLRHRRDRKSQGLLTDLHRTSANYLKIYTLLQMICLNRRNAKNIEHQKLLNCLTQMRKQMAISSSHPYNDQPKVDQSAIISEVGTDGALSPLFT